MHNLDFSNWAKSSTAGDFTKRLESPLFLLKVSRAVDSSAHIGIDFSSIGDHIRKITNFYVFADLDDAL